MAELKLSYSQVEDIPLLKLEGDLTVSNFAALHLVAKGATKFATVPVIADLSGDVYIADDVRDLKCWRTPVEIPEFATRVALVIISTPELLGEIKTLVPPHLLKYAVNLQEALDLIHKESET